VELVIDILLKMLKAYDMQQHSKPLQDVGIGVM
jgi:hypothetical protein